MNIAFEDLKVSLYPDPISGTVSIEWDGDFEDLYIDEIEITATGTLPALSVRNRNRQTATIKALFSEVEGYIMDKYADELDELVPRPRFDPVREWGTYGRQP